MSALPPKADIVQHGGNVRFVPIADIGVGRSSKSLARASLVRTAYCCINRCQRHRDRIVQIQATIVGIHPGICPPFGDALNLISLPAGSELDAVSAFKRLGREKAS